MRGIYRWVALGSVAILVAVVVFPRIDWPLAAATFGQIDWGLLVLAALSVPGLILARAARWQILLKGAPHVGFSTFLSATAISFLAIVLLPGSGEVSRIALMKKRSGLPLGFIGGTVLLEKLVDTSFLIGCLVILILISGATSGLATFVAVASSALVVLLLLGVAVAAAPGLIGLLQNHSGRLSTWPLTNKAFRLAEGMLEGMKTLGAGGLRRAALTLMASLLVLIVGLVPYSLMLWAFDLHLPAFAPLLVITAVNVGMAVPTAPGAVGTFQAVVAGALALMSVEVGRGLAFGAALHVVIFLPIIIMGLIATTRESIPLGSLRRFAAKPEPGLGGG